MPRQNQPVYPNYTKLMVALAISILIIAGLMFHSSRPTPDTTIPLQELVGQAMQLSVVDETPMTNSAVTR